MCGGGKEEIQPWPGKNLKPAELTVLGEVLPGPVRTQPRTPLLELICRGHKHHDLNGSAELLLSVL